MAYVAIYLVLGLLCCFAASAQTQNCTFSEYIQHTEVSSWEFQLDVPPTKLQSLGNKRHEILAAVYNQLTELWTLYVVHNSLRTSIMAQTSYAVSTLDGKPLYPGKHSPTHYSWSGPGFVRYRQKYAMGSEKDNGLLAVRAGQADITLKLKNIKFEEFKKPHEQLDFPEDLPRRRHRYARLKWKIENDHYCSVSRATYEATYHPISMHDEFKTLADVCEFYPHLDELLGISHRSELPLYNQRYFSKSVWNIIIDGVPGVANWVMSYGSLVDALSGVNAVESELSFRLKRSDIEHYSGKDNVQGTLDKLANVCQHLHNIGWDTGVHGIRDES